MRDSYPICQSQVEEKRVYRIPSFGSPERLAQSIDSGAGKRRIFDIGNYVNQWLLKPLHDWAPYHKGGWGDPVEYPFARGRPVVSFETGQPLGYLSSWPLFTLSHHLVLQSCAEKVYPGRYFDRYAILGDDICITDRKIASIYHQVVTNLGVDLSIPKSLVSNSGGAEFSKCFRCHNLSVDFLRWKACRRLLGKEREEGE
ncbi:putative mitochondrial protein [Glycine soja]|uniref:Putative mitochondrial protein n=1 Tax=Glycine soja TaxID=3848 RepID=A0A445HRS8_GLYSO|nr:putative mitochondrial protein [Glycine soja]